MGQSVGVRVNPSWTAQQVLPDSSSSLVQPQDVCRGSEADGTRTRNLRIDSPVL
jgi:hypothetical protein